MRNDVEISVQNYIKRRASEQHNKTSFDNMNESEVRLMFIKGRELLDLIVAILEKKEFKIIKINEQ